MYFDLSNKIEIEQFKTRANTLIKRGAKIELKEKRQSKTLNQNNYIHLILSYFAIETGYSLKYTKEELFKKYLSPDIFILRKRNKNGDYYDDIISWADVSKVDATTAINRFKMWSEDNGLRLPDANEHEFIKYCNNEVERFKHMI